MLGQNENSYLWRGHRACNVGWIRRARGDVGWAGRWGGTAWKYRAFRGVGWVRWGRAVGVMLKDASAAACYCQEVLLLGGHGRNAFG